MSEEEKEALNFFENKEYSFTCEVPKKELYEALGIEETDFETEVIRINTLINLIKKQQIEIEKLKDKNKTLENLLQGNLYEMYLYYKELAGKYQANCISKDTIREKIIELENGSYDAKIILRKLLVE